MNKSYVIFQIIVIPVRMYIESVTFDIHSVRLTRAINVVSTEKQEDFFGPNDAVSGGEDCVFADEAAAAKTFYLSGRTQGNETHLPRELVRLGLDAADDLAGAAVGSAASYLTWIYCCFQSGGDTSRR